MAGEAAIQATVIDLIRHGEPVGGSRYRGQRDDPLSDAGWEQMRAAVGDHCPWHGIVSSPLRRCRDFAEEMSFRHCLPLDVDERLMEIGFGEWEGLTADEVERNQPGALMRYYADPMAYPPPGAEPLAAFRRRIDAAWQDLRRCHAGKQILVVGHAGVIRMCLALVLDLPLGSLFRIRVDHAALTRIQCSQQGDEPPFCQLLFHGGAL